MSFIRDMDRGSDEYAAAVDQVLVHCRDSEFGIRAAGELLQAKMYNPSAAPIEPSISASETFTNFINALENEAGIRIVFVVLPHFVSIHKLYVRFVKESALLYNIVAASNMALVASQETLSFKGGITEIGSQEVPFSATDMLDELRRSYHKKTEAMALVLARAVLARAVVLLHGQTVDGYDSELEYLSAKSTQEEEGEEEEGEEEEEDSLSDNEESIMDLSHARSELGLNLFVGTERDELSEELKGLLMDAGDLHEGLEELKQIEDQMRATGGSMALPPPIKEEPKEASPDSSSAASSASEGKRRRVA
jgi:hypothetical protein